MSSIAEAQALFAARRPLACPSKEGHRYVEGHALSKWEILLYCQRCGQVIQVDATAWKKL